MTSVLVGYASAHGSTRTVAERIGARLGADVRSLDEVEDPGAYDAFVLGSAVHGQAWLPEATGFVRSNRELLAGRPVWVFSVGMPGALRGPWKLLAGKEEPKVLAEVRAALRPRGHRLFSGVVSRDHFPLTGRLMFRLMGCRYGDYRDWAAVDAFADEIARALTGA